MNYYLIYVQQFAVFRLIIFKRSLTSLSRDDAHKYLKLVIIAFKQSISIRNQISMCIGRRVNLFLPNIHWMREFHTLNCKAMEHYLIPYSFLAPTPPLAYLAQLSILYLFKKNIRWTPVRCLQLFTFFLQPYKTTKWKVSIAFSDQCHN